MTAGAHKLTPLAPQHVDLLQGVFAPTNRASIGLGESLPPEDVLRFATDHGFQHICQKNGFNFERDLLSAELLVADPEAYFLHPVSTILKPEAIGAESDRALTAIDQRFDSSAQKRAILEQVGKHLESKGLAQTLIEDAQAVADELVTNAVFNAPFVDPITYVNPGLSRTETEIKLKGGRFGRLILAHDETQMVIGCEDPYGSLNLESYLSKIRATYLRGPAATMNFGSGGAGLGSYIIFNAGASLFFGVKQSRVTLMCCSLPMRLSYKKRVLLPKHLHWFQF